LFYVLSVGGIFVLRRTQPQAARPYRAIGYPVVPAAYIAMASLIMIDLLIMKPRYT
jgi:APA family basic amino acid/polyamine antiporter